MKGKRHSGITIIFLVEIICNAWLSRVRVQCLMSFFLLSNGCRSSRIFGEFKDTSNYLIPLRHWGHNGVVGYPVMAFVLFCFKNANKLFTLRIIY
jgi:hypothetical protein